MVNEEVNNFVTRLVAEVGDQLDSVTFYPHPFTSGGLVIVPKDDVKFIPDLMSKIYGCRPPVSIYCLRRSELFQLSIPGVFGWPYPLEEKPHLAFWLKNKGVVLHGRDIRGEIRLPEVSASLLEIHLQRVKHCIRNWAFDQLWLKNYKVMVKEMERQTKYLMATALLSKNVWDILPDAIPDRFDGMFNNGRAKQIWADIAALTRRDDEADETAARQSALESLWLFEQFMSQMGGYTR